MRVSGAFALVALVACDGNAAGTLICKERGRTFSIAVAPDGLAEVRAHAEAAGFTDCELQAVARAEPARRTLQIPERRASPPEEDEVDLPPPPPPPPPPPAPPQNVPPTLLEVQRMSGSRSIQPDGATELEILRSGKDKVLGAFKLCVTETGEVSTVSQLKSTGFADYDAKLMREMRAWTFRPYLINGTERSVCTAYTFTYAVP